MNKQLLFFVSILLYTTVFSQTSYVWNGTTSTNWGTNTNWTPNGIPGSLDNVTIVTGANNCILAGNTTVTNLTITSGILNLNAFTLNTTGIVACNGGSCTNGTFNSTATALTFAGTTFGANITANVTEVYFNGSVFNGNVTVSKNGAVNAQSTGNNTFNGNTSITNAGTGYLLLTNGGVGRNETFNGITTLNTTNIGALYIGYGRDVSINANMIINNTSSTGNIQIGRVGVVNLNTGVGITCGTFSGAALNLYNVSQTGSSALTLSPGNTGGVNIFGSNITGPVTVNAGIISAQTSTFATTVTYNAGGTILNTWSSGGNTYNGVLTVNNSSNGYLGFANGTADTYNADVYANNTSTTGGRIIFGNNCTSQFNGNIYASQTGNTAAGGIALGWGGTFPIINLAATKSIITSGTFNSGYLQLYRVQQLGVTANTINATGTANVILNNNIFSGALTVTAPDITPNGGTYNGAVIFNKTGGTSNHNSGNLNIFNSTCTINQTSSTGYFMLGYNSADQFNDDIILTSTGTGGIRLGHNSGTGTPTLASGKTVSIGGAGFSTGYLVFGSFTQLGSAPINLNTTGSCAIYVNNANSPCVFGGAFNATAADLYIQGGTFNGPAIFTKTGGVSEHNNGVQNIFNSTCTINQQSNTGYLMLGYNSNDLFNDDITVTSSGTGGIYLGYSSGTGTPILASGKTVNVGGAGFNSGFLYFGGFTQLGSAPINLNLAGATTSLVFRASTFGGNIISTSASILFNGNTFNGSVNSTKTGTSSDASAGGNIFNSTSEFINSGSGYFMFGNGTADIWNGDVIFTNNGSERILPCWSSAGNLFNGNIILNSTGSSVGIQFCGGNVISTATLAATKTINTATFDKGYLILNRFTQLGSAAMNLNLAVGSNYLTLGPLTTIGGNFTAVAPSINNIITTTFNGTTDITKNGAPNDQWTGGNTFNSTADILNSGSGYLLLGGTNPEVFNGDVTFTNTGSSYISPSYNSTGNLYNGNITVNSIGSSLGINFSSGGLGTSTLAANKTIQIGGSGFTAGYLLLQRFTQLGNAPINLTLPIGSNYLTIGPNSTIGGNLTVDAQSINNILSSTFNGVVSITKNGNTNDSWTGGNTFNAVASFTNNGSGYLILANGSPDIFNGDVTFTQTGTERILPAYNSAGNIFNGNISVNSIGTSQGINFCAGAISTATLAATKTILVGGSGFTSGYLILQRFTQLGNAPINLTLSSTASYIQYGPASAFGGNVTSVSPRLFFNGCNFSGTTNCTKTGAVDDVGIGNNIFNGNATMTNSGSGYLMFGNGNADQFNGNATFNNLGTNHIYVAHNSSNNVFGGVATFSNATTGNYGIYVSGYSAGTVFNDNIIVSNVNGSGVQFCYANVTSNATLITGKTITIGSAGFNSGTLLLKQFTQVGPTPQSLNLVGTSILQYGPISTFNGNVTSVSPRLYFNGCTFNGTANCTKNGATDDQGIGNNIFNGTTTITSSGSGYLMFGNGNSDQFNSTATFINTGTNNMHIAYNSSNNIFGGVTTFSNSPTGNFGIYVTSLSSGTLFNDNIIVSSTNGQGVQFCSGNATATATLAASKTISIGAAGFTAGTLLLKQFTQLGATPQTLNITSGNAILTLGPISRFDGNVNFNFPQVLLNGTTYNGFATIQKNGATDNPGIGGNIFNGTTIINNTGSGYLMTGNGKADTFNGVTTFNNTGTYRIYFANNHVGQTTIFAQAAIINSNKSGGVDAWSYLITENPNTNVRFDGDLTINIGGTLQSNLRILQGSNSTATYNGNLNVNLTNTNSNTQIQLGTVGTSAYNGNITVVNTGAGTSSGVFFNTSANATSNLAASKTISLGAGGFNGGTLSLIRFTQLGGTAQTLNQTSGTGILISGPASTFNGDVNFNFPQVYLNGTTYNGLATIQKNGATDNSSVGGNTFNGTTTITNISANFIRLANTTADAYNGDVTFAQNNSGILAPNYNANCTYAGNVTVSSSTTNTITFGSAAGGIATFNDGTNQTINKTGSAGNPVFTRIIINKSAGDITLNTRVNVSSYLTPTQGIINTTATNILNMNNASTTTIGNSSSYINGPMNYDMALNGTRVLNFPIGKVEDWRPASLNAIHNNATSYTYKAELTNTDANTLGWAFPATVNLASHVHWWDIERSNTTTSVVTPTLHLNGNQTITLYYGANDGVTDPANLTIIKNTATAPNSWIDIGGAGATLTSGSVSSTSAPSAFNSFSRFSLGNKTGGTNPLPIELLYFTAKPVDKTVNLDWATASETNNDYYEIERSTNGVDFEFVNKINAYGNGNSVIKQTYNTIDEKPYKGISYYRLKQVDKTGDFKYSNIVSVEFNSKSFVNIFPNPASNQLNINYSEDFTNASIKIINSVGAEVITNSLIDSFKGNLDVSNLADGIYYVIIQNGEHTENIKLNIQK